MRFPEFKGEWEEKRLEDFIDLISGVPIKSEDISEDKQGTPILRGINITEGFIRHSDDIDRYYPKEITNDIRKYLLNEKDLVLGMDGSKVGKNVALISESDAGSILIQRVAKINAKTNADINFIYQKIFSDKFRKYVDVVNTSSGIPHISLQQIKDFETGFPLTLSEQQKIASFLSLIDSRIQTQNKIIAQLQTLMTGLGEQLFKQNLRFKDEKGNDFPDWEEKFGNEVFENISDKNHNSDLPILAVTQDHGAIPRDLIDYKITVTEKSIESYKVVQIGDFIISLRSFQGGIEYSKYKGLCSPAYIILRTAIPINRIYFKYYFKTDKYITELNRKLEGIRDGKMISYGYFSEILLPFPSIVEQDIIANFLSSIDEKIETDKKILQQYENQKRYLLKNMFV